MGDGVEGKKQGGMGKEKERGLKSTGEEKLKQVENCFNIYFLMASPNMAHYK